jgi:hypothetical protein
MSPPYSHQYMQLINFAKDVIDLLTYKVVLVDVTRNAP